MSDTPEGNICKVSANLGWASDTLGVLDKVLLKLSAEVKTILRERDNFQDQRDFAMGEIERLREQIAEYETVRHAMAVELLQVKNESAVRQENHALKVRLIAALKERDEAREALRSVMDWNPKPEYWERPETVARFEADMAKARKILEETE